MTNEEREDLELRTYILWIDYFSEGWKPIGFSSADEVAIFIKKGIGNPFVVTRGTVPIKVGP